MISEPLEIYCQVILHSGCALVQGQHKWSECPAQYVYRRIARKHQHQLNSSGIAIGDWIQYKKIQFCPYCGNRLAIALYGHTCGLSDIN